LAQHQFGKAATLDRFLGGTWSPEQAKDWFSEQRIVYLRRWPES